MPVKKAKEKEIEQPKPVAVAAERRCAMPAKPAKPGKKAPETEKMEIRRELQRAERLYSEMKAHYDTVNKLLADLHDWLLRCPEYDPREMIGEGFETIRVEDAREKLRHVRTDIGEAESLAKKHVWYWEERKDQALQQKLKDKAA